MFEPVESRVSAPHIDAKGLGKVNLEGKHVRLWRITA